MNYIAFICPIGFCYSRATPVVETENCFCAIMKPFELSLGISVFGILLRYGLGSGKLERK